MMRPGVLGLSLAVLFGGEARAEEAVTPPAGQLAYAFGSQLIGNLLDTHKKVNRLTIKPASAGELSTELKKLLKNPELKMYRLAVVDLQGKVLVCEPPGEAEQVGARPNYPQTLGKVSATGREFITQARMSPEQRLTYDVFFPLRSGLDYESEVTGYFHANIEPSGLVGRAVAAKNLRADEIAYVLTDQGWLLYHSGPRPGQYLELLDAENRKQQSRYRVMWRKMFEDAFGSATITALASKGLGVYRHQVSWQHYMVQGTTWIVVHDKVRESSLRDPANPLTGTWQAFDLEPAAGQSPEVAFTASVVQEETWWNMRAVASDWSFSGNGRFLEDRLTSKRSSAPTADKPYVFLVNGTWDKVSRKLNIQVYWQMDRYNVSVRSYELLRLKGRAPKPPPRAKPRIPLRVLRP